MIGYIDYITQNTPDAAADLCDQYGLNPQSLDDISQGLTLIIENEGPAGLRKVLALHPDKNVIIENFAGNSNFRNANGNVGTSCTNGGCGGCKLSSMLVKTNQASGGTSAMAPRYYPNQQQNTNNLLIIGIVSLTVIAGLIIHKNNN